MSAHTPGPWFNTWANRITPTKNSDGSDSIAHVYDRKNMAEYIANARLIAAAPKMLDGLKTTRSNIVSLRDAGLPGPLTEWLRVVDEAIAKATKP